MKVLPNDKARITEDMALYKTKVQCQPHTRQCWHYGETTYTSIAVRFEKVQKPLRAAESKRLRYPQLPAETASNRAPADVCHRLACCSAPLALRSLHVCNRVCSDKPTKCALSHSALADCKPMSEVLHLAPNEAATAGGVPSVLHCPSAASWFIYVVAAAAAVKPGSRGGGPATRLWAPTPGPPSHTAPRWRPPCDPAPAARQSVAQQQEVHQHDVADLNMRCITSARQLTASTGAASDALHSDMRSCSREPIANCTAGHARLGGGW